MRSVSRNARACTLSTDHGAAARGDHDLPEPLALVGEALRSCASARDRFPGCRLTKLVSSRLELDDGDIAQWVELLDIGGAIDALGPVRPFDRHLRHVIAIRRLGALFRDDGPGLYHHAIRPAGYNFDRDEVMPAGMEQWRADYRAMPDDCQMLAASIIWLYRGGKDNIWLRRVPCTWHAADAIECMRAAGALADWACLFALYPGW